MSYTELKVHEMSTGQLAIAYQKLDKLMSRVAGGCWEFKRNNMKTAASHRIHITSIRQADGSVDVVAVKTIDVVRHREGFVVEDNLGYETSCHNARCFNPAHQIKPKVSRNTAQWSAEMQEQCGLLRKHGWSTHYQRTAFPYTCYLAVKDMEEYTPTVLPNLTEVVKVDVVNQIFTLFHTDGSPPTIDEILAGTGLTFETLLPYGYAVLALEQRTKSLERRESCGAMLSGFVRGLPVKEISTRTQIPPTTIYAFRGALYG